MSLQFAVGWMVDRWNVNLIMVLGFLVWSLSTAPTVLATGFGMILVMRLQVDARLRPSHIFLVPGGKRDGQRPGLRDGTNIGRTATGGAMGMLQNGGANLSGIAGPPLTGLLVDWTGHFAAALGGAALVAVVGGFAWVLGVHKQEEPKWQAAQETYL
jgi:MFS family permease